jgi:hypothetical protein
VPTADIRLRCAAPRNEVKSHSLDCIVGATGWRGDAIRGEREDAARELSDAGRSPKEKVAGVQCVELHVREHERIIVVKVDDHVGTTLGALGQQFAET